MTTRNTDSLALVTLPVLVASNTNSRRLDAPRSGAFVARLDPVVTRLANGRTARHFVVLLDDGAGRPVFVSRARFDRTADAVRHVLAVRKALDAGADPSTSDKWAAYIAPVPGVEYAAESAANAE